MVVRQVTNDYLRPSCSVYLSPLFICCPIALFICRIPAFSPMVVKQACLSVCHLPISVGPSLPRSLPKLVCLSVVFLFLWLPRSLALSLRPSVPPSLLPSLTSSHPPSLTPSIPSLRTAHTHFLPHSLARLLSRLLARLLARSLARSPPRHFPPFPPSLSPILTFSLTPPLSRVLASSDPHNLANTYSMDDQDRDHVASSSYVFTNLSLNGHHPERAP